MASSLHSVHIKEFTHRITLHVRGLKGFGVRLWLARQCFLFGAWVAGVGIAMEDDQAGDR